MSSGIGIPQRVLLACAPLGPKLPAESVIQELAAGLRAGGRPEVDPCPLPMQAKDIAGLLARLDFDARMRAARAVLVATGRLSADTLPASLTFEIATRARQAGVPCFAVAAQSRLDAFDARIMDLQLVLLAGSSEALRRAGGRLAEALAP